MLPDPSTNDRAINIVEWAAKFAIALGSLKVFLSGIYKPFSEWRKDQRAHSIRQVLAPELAQLQKLIAEETGCAENMRVAVESIKQVFHELDGFLAVATENRERINETNELLDEIFHLDRRVDKEKEKQIDNLITMLAGRRQVRARNLDTMQRAIEADPEKP